MEVMGVSEDSGSRDGTTTDGTTTDVKTVEIGAASAVSLQVYGELVLRQGPAPKLRIVGDPELVAKAQAEVRGETLELTLGRDWVDRLASGLAMLGNRPLRYEVTLPALRRIEVAGRGRFDLDGLDAEALTVRVSGLADGTLTGLTLSTLEVEIAGRAELTLAGRVAHERLRVSGSAQLDAWDLRAERAEVRISGHGEVGLAVAGQLEARITGYGNVTYDGDPEVDQTVSGGGAVRRGQRPADAQNR